MSESNVSSLDKRVAVGNASTFHSVPGSIVFKDTSSRATASKLDLMRPDVPSEPQP